MNKEIYVLKTPYEVSLEIAERAKEKRRLMKLSQKSLAERSGVSLGSVKRFEQKGEVSLTALLKIALVLDCLKDFEKLFEKPKYTSIEEIINEKSR